MRSRKDGTRRGVIDKFQFCAALGRLHFECILPDFQSFYPRDESATRSAGTERAGDVSRIQLRVEFLKRCIGFDKGIPARHHVSPGG
jgi:hypothetical protein